MSRGFVIRFFAVPLICLMAFFAACSSSTDEENASTTESIDKADAIINALNQQGFQVVNQVTIDGDVGFLAEIPGSLDNKRCVVLTGKPYSLGYQMGSLLPNGTYNMARIYTENLLEEYAYAKKGTALFNLIKDMATTLAKSAVHKEHAIPEYLLQEMQGVVDGANAKNDAEHQITFEDVLVLNEGLDTLYSMLFTHKIPNTEGATQDILGCNGFVVSGDATVDKKVYHGRDFMLATGGVFQDEALMAVYIPDQGMPFVTLGAPGFVGQTTGLNDGGLSMGVDVVFGGATRSTPGMGCLFVIRDIIQNCSNLDEAVDRMKSQNRGVSWIYVIADNYKSEKYTNGIVVEEGKADDYSGPDILPWFTQNQMADLIEKLPADEIPEKGVITRPQDWVYPADFVEEEDFPKQIEKYDDVVIATNNYIHPNMVFTTFSPWMQLLQGNYWKTSQPVERYKDLEKRIHDEYGKIDFETARYLIDFMNPKREADSIKNGYMGWTRYEVNGEVEGFHALFNNKDLIMECLYGYYRPDEPWVKVDLKPFADIANQ